MTTSIAADAGEKARAAVYQDGITALPGAFDPAWADAMRADIEAAFAGRPGLLVVAAR